MKNRLQVCALGPTRYRDGLELMDALVAARAAGETGDWLLYPDHEPVLTIGRNPSQGNLRLGAGELARAGVEVFEVPRGGDVTWHGPGQLVGYPIVALDRVDRDLHRWLRVLEDALIGALARWGLEGIRVVGRTGVWRSEREKLASIGVAVRRWVGYHGFALNVENSLDDFALIHPCGYHDIRMTRLAARVTPLVYHRPSLVQHLAVRSTIGGVRHEAADFDAGWRPLVGRGPRP